MRLTNKGKYGINALIVLAIFQEEGPLSSKAIANRAGIPEHYLEQILRRLRQAELVVSTRGVQGGYRLARPADAIFIGEIVKAAEDSVEPVKCTGSCDHSADCLTRDLWSRVTESMLNTLNGMSLSELCRDAFANPCRGEDCHYPVFSTESGEA